MSISSEITRINGNIAAAYTAANNKGATMPATQNSANLATCIGTISTGITPSGTISIKTNGTYDVTNYASSIVNVPGGSGGYTLHRVKDDNNNEIGTAFMEFEDANGNKYDVVCLDAVYRTTFTQVCGSTVEFTNMPMENNSITSFWYNTKYTATSNTQLILDFCDANGYTSSACDNCRNKSFTIGGVTYYGQLPNMRQLWEIWMNRASIESMDITASSQTAKNFSNTRSLWSSTQEGTRTMMNLGTNGTVSGLSKYMNIMTCPVLEIPK